MLRRKVQILRPASMFNSALCCIMQTRHLRYNKKKKNTEENLQLAVYTHSNLSPHLKVPHLHNVSSWLHFPKCATVTNIHRLLPASRRSLFLSLSDKGVNCAPQLLNRRYWSLRFLLHFSHWHTGPIGWGGWSTCSHGASSGQHVACTRSLREQVSGAVSTGRSFNQCQYQHTSAWENNQAHYIP